VELDEDTVIKLLRAQYGLVQSPRLWMETFSSILTSLGLKQCKTDPCLFCLFDEDGKLLVMVVVYCDDCIITGRSKWVTQIKIGITGQVKISDLGNLKRHLGVDYEWGCDAHGKYIQSSMTEYLASMVCNFETDMSDSIKTNQGVNMRAPKDIRVVAFVDSDYASDRGDRKSISGHLVTVGGCLVSWQSKKQTGVTLSSTEAEFVAISMAATEELKFVVSLLTEMGNGPLVLPSILKEDNTGAIFMAKNIAIGQRTKHVDIRYRFVNDMILSNDLLVEHIRSGENPSDAMTKKLPLNLFGKHASVVSEGLLGNLYDPQNTEDVKSYCASVDAPSTTVSCGQCSDYNCSLLQSDNALST
jgi:hypothetical protein